LTTRSPQYTEHELEDTGHNTTALNIAALIHDFTFTHTVAAVENLSFILQQRSSRTFNMDGTSRPPTRTIKHFIGNKVRPMGKNQEATFSGRYRTRAYSTLAADMMSTFGFPQELADLIFDAAGHIIWVEARGTRVYTHLPSFRRMVRNPVHVSAPPADGSCPFIDKLPAEIRRKILIDELNVLPSRNLPIYPVCGEDSGGPLHRHQTSNSLVDLMLLNKKVRDEVAEAVYEERTFAIHVHPGFQDAGIEFLHVGRQPLQYLDHIGDGRFTKFCTGEMFGFCRLKKIEIHIFPDDGAYQHSAINTYFMNIALVRLLTRNSDKDVDRITSIRVVFRPAYKPTDFDSWWDTAKDRPRETSIHGISDFELLLRPFALLTYVHQVDVQLPEQVDRHVRSVKFVRSLVHCMTATTVQGTFNSDALEMKIESARFALEDHIRRKLYGSGRYIHMPKVTGEEIEEDKQSQDSEDEGDGDDMDVTPEDDPSEDQNDRDMDEDQSAHASQDTADYAMFDEDGGFPDDLDSLHEDMHVAPNVVSEKVARFVECFSVTGDVARRYLERSGDDLERACQLFMDVYDLENAVASKRRAIHDARVSSNDYSDPSKYDGSSGGPSGSGEVDHKRKGEGENKKSKQRATDDDDNVYKNVRWDDDSDEDDDDYNDPNGPSNNQLNTPRVSQTSSQQESDGASWQPYDPTLHAQPAVWREGRRRFSQARNFLGMAAQDRRVSSSTSEVVGSERGRPIERNPVSLVSETTTTTSSNSVRGVARPSRTVVRRDSSTSLAANYSEDGQQVSEYRLYESPRTAISIRQEQRLLYHASVVDTTPEPTQHGSNSNNTLSSSQQPGENIEFASTSRASNAFGDPQSRLNASTDGYAFFNDHTRNTHSEYRDLTPLNAYVRSPFATTPFSRLNSLRESFNMQQSNASQSSTTAQANAPWTGGDFYPGGDINSSTPIAGPYPSLDITNGFLDADWVQAVMREAASVSQVAPGFMPDVDGQASAQVSQHLSTPSTNGNVAPPSLEHSGQTSSLKGMNVDTTEGSSAQEAQADAKQKRDGGF
jgi:hypothetical protein